MSGILVKICATIAVCDVARAVRLRATSAVQAARSATDSPEEYDDYLYQTYGRFHDEHATRKHIQREQQLRGRKTPAPKYPAVPDFLDGVSQQYSMYFQGRGDRAYCPPWVVFENEEQLEQYYNFVDAWNQVEALHSGRNFKKIERVRPSSGHAVEKTAGEGACSSLTHQRSGSEVSASCRSAGA